MSWDMVGMRLMFSTVLIFTCSTVWRRTERFYVICFFSDFLILPSSYQMLLGSFV